MQGSTGKVLHLFSFLFFFLLLHPLLFGGGSSGAAGDSTQGLTHAKPVLYN